MHAIPRNSTQFREYLIASFFRNYSAIARNEMAQAEAPIARNSAQLRASEFRLETLEYMYIFITLRLILWNQCFLMVEN